MIFTACLQSFAPVNWPGLCDSWLNPSPTGSCRGDYYRRSQGERDLIWAFASYEAEQKSGGRCLRVPPKARQISGLSQKKRG